MQTVTLFRGVVVVSMLAMAPVAQAEQFLAKPGAYEVTGKFTLEPNVRNEARRQKMTPEQRAQEDKQLAEMSKPHTSKMCFSKKDMELDEIAVIDRFQDNCTRKTLAKSPTRVVSQKACPNGQTVTFTVEAGGPESMKMEAVIVNPEMGTLRREGQARWVGESCADVPKFPE